MLNKINYITLIFVLLLTTGLVYSQITTIKLSTGTGFSSTITTMLITTTTIPQIVSPIEQPITTNYNKCFDSTNSELRFRNTIDQIVGRKDYTINKIGVDYNMNAIVMLTFKPNNPKSEYYYKYNKKNTKIKWTELSLSEY